jgi:hypothetical protein
MCIVLQANSCPDAEQAKKLVRAIIISILEAPAEAPPNWRVHWMMLKSDTEVSSFDFTNRGGLESYVCGGWCVVFFVDLNPFAHFAHPTRIVVFDSKPPSGEYLYEFDDTKWWPTIRERAAPHAVSIFNTVASREDPLHIFIIGDGAPDGELPLPGAPNDPGIRFVARSTTTGGGGPVPLGPPPTPAPVGEAAAEECDSKDLPVWAILVNGYEDKKNTFDEDVFGMYSVLRGQGVLLDRIQVLSPIPIDGISDWKVVTWDEIDDAFDQTLAQMEDCVESIGESRPHFLLFWSSHGMGGGLSCNSADGSAQDVVWNFELDCWITKLETMWIEKSEKDLATTVVIEACESGLVGEELKGDNAENRWIFTSAKGAGSVSCGDIDEPIADKVDPNPADIGSETIWGYVEAYGTASAHGDDSDGKLSFKEAVQYAKDSDVGFVEGEVAIEHSCKHETMSWIPDAPDPMLVHGAWNTSVRASSKVAFTLPASTAVALFGNPVEVDVDPGEEVKIELEIKNQDAVPEVGVLALRLFRNDETDETKKWKPLYYDGDNSGTTVMIQGLGSSQALLEKGSADIPGSFQEDDEMRMVVTLDSGQPTPTPADTAAVSEAPKSEIVLKVKKKCKSICCWWRDLWD